MKRYVAKKPSEEYTRLLAKEINEGLEEEVGSHLKNGKPHDARLLG